MKITATLIRKKDLGSNFFNIGVSTKIRNYDNIESLIQTPQKIDMLRLTRVGLGLRKSLVHSSNIIAKRGHIIFYSPLLEAENFGKFKNYLKGNWKHGFISNFKFVKRTGERFPNFIVVATNNNTEQKSIENEVLRARIASLVMSNSNNPRGGLFSIPGNNNSKPAVRFLAKLFATTALLGHLKEAANLRSVKVFPRLDSNQRPRA